MDVFNKLYSSVSSTVSHLSGVLPGNPVTREYEILSHTSSGGAGLLWKIYNGFKKSTKQEVSVFVFEKKQLERWPKEDREIMFDILKRGIQQLTKIRHPHVLTVQHPLEESRESLAFAAEPVYACLASLLLDNESSLESSQDIIKTDENNLSAFEKKLHDVEIKHGILQLSEGLMFLHSDVKIIHRNLCPESIIINKQGNWKIFGFDFCVMHQMRNDGKPFWPHHEYNSTWHSLTQPYLEYTAPEVTLNSINTPDSDLFSLGVLIYALYSGGKPIKFFGKDYASFRKFASELNQGKYPNLSCIPTGLSNLVKALLNPSPAHRPRLHELSKIPFFDDVRVKTLNYLDSLYQWDNLEKSKFYKGLPQIITTLPHRINLQHILPCIIKEFVNLPMIPFVLPNVLLIAEKCSKKEFVEEILPHLKSIMKLQEPVQILLIFMKKMDILLKLTPPDDVKENILPMLYRALECDIPQMQELCLNILPTFSFLLDYSATKNALLPRIKKLCLNSPNVPVKVNCLLCIGKLLESLDKWLVLDDILPFLTQVQSREPAVLMAITGIYKIAMTNSKLGITKDIMASKIIPFLMPLCIENGLTVNQFNSIISLVKDMVAKVECEQRTKLKQLNTIQKDVEIIDPVESLSEGFSPPKSSLENMFANIENSSISDLSGSLENQKSREQKSQKPLNETLKPDLVPAIIDANLNKLSQSLIMNSRSSNNSIENSIINSNRIQISNSGNVNNFTSTNNSNVWLQPQQKYINKSTEHTNSINLNSLNSLDPFKGFKTDAIKNNATTNKIQMNQMKISAQWAMGNINTLNNSNVLGCQNEQKQENTNLTTLSQQDILEFLK